MQSVPVTFLPSIAAKYGTLTALYLGRLLMYSGQGTKECYYTDALATEELHVSPRKIRNSLKQLKQLGLVSFSYGKSKSDAVRHRVYRLNMPLLEKIDAEYVKAKEEEKAKKEQAQDSSSSSSDVASRATCDTCNRHDVPHGSGTTCHMDVAPRAAENKEVNNDVKEEAGTTLQIHKNWSRDPTEYKRQVAALFDDDDDDDNDDDGGTNSKTA